MVAENYGLMSCVDAVRRPADPCSRSSWEGTEGRVCLIALMPFIAPTFLPSDGMVTVESECVHEFAEKLEVSNSRPQRVNVKGEMSD